MAEEIKVVQMTGEQTYALRKQSRSIDIMERRIGSLVTQILEELEEREVEFWDTIAQIAGFKNNMESQLVGKRLIVNWVSQTIRIEESED